MLFTKHTQPDGTETVTVDRWDQQVDWAPELLSQAEPSLLRREGNIIHVNVANGWAKYQIIEWDDLRYIVHSRLLCSFLDKVG